jgi:N-acetylglutamate synthase-like GNAT family acetyltransferase
MSLAPDRLRQGGDVRPARPGDLPALDALAARCSFDTLYRRFHGATGTPLRRELARTASSTDGHRSWVAVRDGEVRGVATLAVGRSGQAEVAFLVEDAWQRRGVGRALALRLGAEACRSGHGTLSALVQADNDRVVRFAKAVAPGTIVTFDGAAEFRFAIPVAPPAREAARRGGEARGRVSRRAGTPRSPRLPAPT